MDEHLFLIRLWCEYGDSEMARPEWRGLVRHVATDEQQYFNDLANLSLFLAAYLEEMGVNLGAYWHTRLWQQREEEDGPQSALSAQ